MLRKRGHFLRRNGNIISLIAFLLQTVTLITRWGIATVEVKSIVVSGGSLFLFGGTTFIFGGFAKRPLGTALGMVAVVFVMVIVLIILLFELSLREAQQPIPFLILSGLAPYMVLPTTFRVKYYRKTRRKQRANICE